MQTVSSLYNAYPDERWSNIRVTFDLVDTDAAEDGTATATSEAAISQLSQTHNRVNYVSKKISTLEPNGWISDGSFDLPDRVDNGEVGWWSGALSGIDRVFITPQGLEFNFTADHSSIGFTIMFDDKCNVYPSDFTIQIYDSTDTLLATDIVTDNTQVVYVSETPVENYRKVVITFTKTAEQHRRVRVAEVVFGIVQMYDKGNSNDITILYELSPNMENLPSNELSLVIDNLDHKYNIINPAGVYQYLQQGQKMLVDCGVGTTKDNLEYITMGQFYYTSSSAEDNSMTASIVAHDLIYDLDKGTYRKGLYDLDTVANIVDSIVSDSGLDITIDMSPTIASRTISKAIPIVSHREALRLVAQASRSVCYVDRDNKLVFRELAEGAVCDTLDSSNLYQPAKVSAGEYINSVEVGSYGYKYGNGGEIGEIYNGTIVINGTKTLWINYNDPSQDITPTITGGTIDSAEYYFFACKLTITATTDVTLVLNGYIMEQVETTYKAEQLDGNPANVKRIENPLIYKDIVQDFANYCLIMEQKQLNYELQERGNPARELTDTVKIYDAYSVNRNAIITKQEFEYDGTLKASSTAWGG